MDSNEELFSEEAILKRKKLDPFGLDHDPEHFLGEFGALEALKNHKGKLTIFTNCKSKITISGKEYNRFYDTLICSENADIAFFLSSARYTDKDLGEIRFTGEDLFRYLDKNNMEYEIIEGIYGTPKQDDPDLGELIFARNEEIATLGMNESAELGSYHTKLYPDVEGELCIGMYLKNEETEKSEYRELYNLQLKGVIDSGRDITFVVNESNEGNLSKEELISLISNFIEEHNEARDKAIFTQPDKRTKEEQILARQKQILTYEIIEGKELKSFQGSPIKIRDEEGRGE